MFVSAEIRWFWQDDCPANLCLWFNETPPPPGGGKLRVDEYLFGTDSSDISIKMRGGGTGLQIKGLVATRKPSLISFAPHFELWCKWSLRVCAVETTEKMTIRKLRWLRTYDAFRDIIVEIPLGANETPVDGQPLPQQGCNVEITKIQVAENSTEWWFEAFGDLYHAPIITNRRSSAQTTGTLRVAR
jgi:hypothetical protein